MTATKFGMKIIPKLRLMYSCSLHRARIYVARKPIGTQLDITIFSKSVTLRFCEVIPCNMVRMAIGRITIQVGIVIMNQFKLITSSNLKAHRERKPPISKLGSMMACNKPESEHLSCLILNSAPVEK
ncbi:unnamed protein product [Moneuplotes crassus]|uniref:Uncharacterized protein n=1 Tax=Euplotes crassus TaxID=5936 RepID=A0AAD1Y1S5_EUPCR|nr:unnamed protein product [Moneuplotes crassus]